MNSKIGLIPALLTITAVLALLFAPAFAESQSPRIEANRPLPAPILNPSLVPICTCESGQGSGEPQHFDLKTGGVLHGKINPNDIGMCQVNVEPRNGHIQAATKMGLDVYTENGNIQYSNWLYREYGLTPWNSSKSCWGAIHPLSTTTH